MDLIRLTERQKQSRRARNRALAWVLVALVAIFFAITIIKLGAARPV